MTMLKADIKKWIEGTQAFEKKDFNGCITVLQQANESSKICFALGMAYFNLNIPKDALYYFGRSVEFDQYLAVGYFMRGVCSILTNDADGAYWDFYTALEKLREHEFIDYTQLKMTYRLLRSEILFNLSLSLLMGGRDASQFVAEARNCSEIHDEQKNEFYAGLQKMQSGQSSGLKPLAIDKSKVFQPPKLTADVGPGGGGGGGSSKAPAVRFSSVPQQEERAPSKPQAIPQKTVTSFGGTPPVSGPRFTPNTQAAQSYPSNSSPGPKSLPGRPGGATGGPGRLPTPSKSLPPPPGGRGGPGGPPTKFAQSPPETIRVKVFYKDKRLVEIPKTGATLSDVKSRVETKFGANGLQIKYQAASGTMKQISNQRDLDEALAAAISELYVNKPGEVNEFEPKPPADDWQECYADDGAVYYFNMNTGESSWDPPEAFLSKQKSAPANSGKGGNKKSDWIECFTDDGQKYYYNSKTDESSWDPPS